MSDLARLLAYLVRVSGGSRRARLTFAGVIAAGIGSGLALAALIGAVNTLLAAGGAPSRALVATFLVLLVARPALRFLAHFLVLRITETGFVTLRMELCRRVVATPLRRLEELGRARLTAALATDVGQIVNAMVLLPTVLMHASVLAGFLAYLGWLFWPLLPPLLLLTAAGAVSIRWMIRRGMVRVAAGRQLYDRLFHQMRGVTEGTKELQVHQRRRGEFMARMEGTAREHRREMRLGDLWFGVMTASSELLFFLAVALVLLAGPHLVAVPPATLASFVVAILMMRGPLEALLDGTAVLGQATVAARKVEELTGSLAAPAPDVPLPAPRRWRSLELDGVTHSYRGEADERFVLGPLTLALSPGEMVFVVGGNGSGKTTFAKVLLGLYAPESGEIRLDGRAVEPAGMDAYRQHFSAVFSDFFLFESLMGVDAADLDGDARRYLSALHLQHKVRVSGGELSTVDLSQGQRKRLALLGAYLEDRHVCLFDEWAADQDPHFKEVFYRHLLPELRARGKTLVVISHDDQYYGVADRVVRLDYGQVTFDGSAAEYLDGGHAARPPAFAGAVAA
ncbi:MAG TPA: cyclic peptide export ABC transporter [Longimicrobium sp.]|nr:cyclic peptide export ABC transporter [Longimicrobium sp.]